jgi:hypothetical protein
MALMTLCIRTVLRERLVGNTAINCFSNYKRIGGVYSAASLPTTCSRVILRLNFLFYPRKLVRGSKGKVVLVLKSAPRNEGVLGEWRYSFTHSLTSALDGEWSASRPGCFTPDERAPGIHSIGGWVDLRADGGEEEKIPFPVVNRTPVVQSAACSLY